MREIPLQDLTQPSSGRWLFGWGDTAQERQILYRELQADVHACFPAHLCLCPSVWEAGGLRRVAQASSKKAHLPMEELVQARSLQNAVCTNTSAKSTFCLATLPEQGSVLLCNGQHLPTGSWGAGVCPEWSALLQPGTRPPPEQAHSENLMQASQVEHHLFIAEIGIKCLAVAQLCPTCATTWTVARQASLSMGFSGQEYCSGLPLLSPIKCLLFASHCARHSWMT